MALLDALDVLPRTAIRQRVWRTVRQGRDPLQGSASRGRWGGDNLETLYTAQEENGAIAEIHSLLSLQPIFPSKLQWFNYEVMAEIENIASLPSLPDLAKLGVNTENYRMREYERTQEIADAAFFLGFNGLLVPNARWNCANLVIFTDRIAPGALTIVSSDQPPEIDWKKWREVMARKPR